MVYSEMQDHESEMPCMIDRKRKELFYPKGSSYAAITGGDTAKYYINKYILKLGALHELRHLCSNERVQNYHKDFYHLQNIVEP